MDLVALTAIPDNPDLVALAALPDPLERAAAADEVMWLGPRGTYAHAREIRRSSLLEALTTGRPLEEVATRLGVRPTDVPRLADL